MKLPQTAIWSLGQAVYHGSSYLGWSDKITNPYGPGMLYQTGREARIMPDGRLEFLEQGGRTVMREGLTGRKFLDLYKLEQT